MFGEQGAEFIDDVRANLYDGGMNRESGLVWVLRSKEKYLVSEDWYMPAEEGKEMEYRYLYVIGNRHGEGRVGTPRINEARVLCKRPVPPKDYNPREWDVVRCRIQEEAIEEPYDEEWARKKRMGRCL